MVFNVKYVKRSGFNAFFFLYTNILLLLGVIRSLYTHFFMYNILSRKIFLTNIGMLTLSGVSWIIFMIYSLIIYINKKKEVRKNLLSMNDF